MAEKKKGKAPPHDWVPEILEVLMEGPTHVPDLEERLGTSRYNLYRHLNNFENEGLVRAETIGKKMKVYHLTERGRMEAENILGRDTDEQEVLMYSKPASAPPMMINALTTAPVMKEAPPRERETKVEKIRVPKGGNKQEMALNLVYEIGNERQAGEFEEIEYIIVVGKKWRR